MKISKLFHWLYFSVMALPLLVAPIFGIFAHRHDVAEDVSYTESVPVYYETNDLYTSSDFVLGNAYSYIDDLPLITVQSTTYLFQLKKTDNLSNLITDFDLVTDIRLVYSTDYQLFMRVLRSNDVTNWYDLTYISFDFVPISIVNPSVLNVIITSFTSCSDLIESYQDVITTVPQDVMDSFINQYYYAIDKYFNYDNALGLGTLYTWLNTNFFSGQAPLGFFIFWHLLIYWLLTSILWLIFDVLMYVPQLVHRWLDKASIS